MSTSGPIAMILEHPKPLKLLKIDPDSLCGRVAKRSTPKLWLKVEEFLEGQCGDVEEIRVAMA